MALRPVTPRRVFDLLDAIGVCGHLDGKPSSDHQAQTVAAVRYIGVKHVRSNGNGAPTLNILTQLNADGVSFHGTASGKPPKPCDENDVKVAIRKRIDWMVANKSKFGMDSAESFNEWFSSRSKRPNWAQELQWAQKELKSYMKTKLRGGVD